MKAPVEPVGITPQDELITELDLRDFVVDRLQAIGITLDPPSDPNGPDVVDEDERLGLARVRGLTDGNGRIEDIDAVLAELRLRCRADFGRWEVPLGKSRESTVPALDVIVGTGTKPMFGVAPTVLSSLSAGTRPASGTGRGVRIGVVDVDPAAAEPASSAVSVQPIAGHGAFVASLITAKAPAVTLTVAGAMNPISGRVSLWHAARAIMDLAAPAADGRRIDILNLSLGCFTRDGRPPLLLRRVLERLDPGVLVVAAAGNHGNVVDLYSGDNPRTRRSPMFPATLPGVVAVGAVDAAGKRADFSPNLPWVGYTALGVDVEGVYVDGLVELPLETTEFTGFATWSGTSFAAANLTGAVAAVMSPGTSTTRLTTAREALLHGKPEGVQPFVLTS